MIKKLVPIILIFASVGGGIGAGLSLKPEATEMVMLNPCGDAGHEAEKAQQHTDEYENSDEEVREYVKLNNQFVVPIVSNELVESLVVMSLSVEISAGLSDTVYAREPKLRDAFLQVLFDHANIGGFKGAFTDANNMKVLRTALSEVAQNVVGPAIIGVLITDIARQDV